MPDFFLFSTSPTPIDDVWSRRLTRIKPPWLFFFFFVESINCARFGTSNYRVRDVNIIRFVSEAEFDSIQFTLVTTTITRNDCVGLGREPSRGKRRRDPLGGRRVNSGGLWLMYSTICKSWPMDGVGFAKRLCSGRAQPGKSVGTWQIKKTYLNDFPTSRKTEYIFVWASKVILVQDVPDLLDEREIFFPIVIFRFF